MGDKVWEYKSNEDDKLAKQVKKDRTIVMTKATMAKDLIKRVPFADGDIVLEPCKGDGAFFDNFPDNVEKKWCEINEGRDFFEFEGEVDWVLSNPPFVPRKLFWDFMEKSMDITRKGIYWLINLSSLNVFTPRRLQIMQDKGWYIQSFHIVADKRWYGRYVFLEITKSENKIFSWKKESY